MRFDLLVLLILLVLAAPLVLHSTNSAGLVLALLCLAILLVGRVVLRIVGHVLYLHDLVVVAPR